MASLDEKYLNGQSVGFLWKKIQSLFVKKENGKVLSDNNYTDNEKNKLDTVEYGANNYSLPTASIDTLGGIRLGDGLTVDARGVVSTVANQSVNMSWTNVVNKPNTLAGYGITDAATTSDIEALEDRLTAVYHYRGSVGSFDDLLAIENPEHGDVYNIIDTGKNYAWVEEDQEWDDLAGIVDLSEYVRIEDLDFLTESDIDLITGSASSAEAFTRILANSNNVQLDNDLTLPEVIEINKAVIVDLNGNELKGTNSGNTYMFQVGEGGVLTIRGNGDIQSTGRIANATDGGKIIIENGTFTSGDVGFSAQGEGSKVTFNDGEVQAVEGGFGAFSGGEIEMNGGYIEVSDNFGLFTNGTPGWGGNTITMNGGTIVGNIKSNGYEAIGVYIANNDTFVMNGGEIRANDGAGLLMRGGNVIINDGIITATGAAGTTGWIGDNKTKMSKSGIIYHESANYPGKDGMRLEVNGGIITGVDNSIEVLSNEAEPQVFISGGTLFPAY